MLERKNLLTWYQKNYRKLPWRETKDPYRIWISEIMCQQTRVAAVIEYYKKFMNRFPDVEALATAPESDVLEHWAGLGYYSRARNIHKAAKQFVVTGFPQSWEELIQYPGLGDYTSRAISSFSFQEKVGVLDGNVVRFLSRFYGAAEEVWTSIGKKHLQQFADVWAQERPELVNQAMMEIGATICLPTSPHCTICPVRESCVAREHQITELLPLKKQKRAEEKWSIHFELVKKGNLIAITKQHDLPVLKSQYFPVCKSRKLDTEPGSKALFQHSVTHHKFYVFREIIDLNKPKMRKYWETRQTELKDLLWVSEKDIKKYCQSSLVQKLLL